VAEPLPDGRGSVTAGRGLVTAWSRLGSGMGAVR